MAAPVSGRAPGWRARLAAKLGDMEWRYALCNHTRHYLFVRCRYPAFTPDYIARHVDRPETSAEELRAYLENSSLIRRNKALILVCVYLTYCLKSLYAPYKVLTLFDGGDPASSVRVLAGSQHPTELVRQVACLATNCSRLAPLASGSGARDSIDKFDAPGDGLAAVPARASLTAGPLDSQAARLASELGRLPLFKLCHPLVSAWYAPVSSLGSLGVLILLCVSFNAFLLGSWCTLQQLAFPARNELIMFIVAPRATARVAQRRCRELLASVSASYANFCINSKLRFFTQTEREYRAYSARLAGGLGAPVWAPGSRGPPSRSPQRSPQRSTSPSEQPPLQGAARRAALRQRRRRPHEDDDCYDQQQHAGQRHGHEGGPLANDARPLRSEREIEAMAHECLPIIRTAEWRRALANMFLSILLATVGEILALTVFAFIYIQQRIVRKRQQLAVFAAEMRRQNCHLWYSTAEQAAAEAEAAAAAASFATTAGAGRERPVAQRELIDLANFQLNWTLFSRMEAPLLNFMPALGVSMMFAYYWGVVREVEIWLAELRTMLVATLVVSRARFSRAAVHHWDAQLTRRPPHGLLTPPPPPPPWLVVGAHEPPGDELARVKTKHFYSIRQLRRRFLLETRFFVVTYMSRIRHCRFRPADGAIEYARAPSLHNINARVNFKAREVHFMDLVARASGTPLLAGPAASERRPLRDGGRHARAPATTLAADREERERQQQEAEQDEENDDDDDEDEDNKADDADADTLDGARRGPDTPDGASESHADSSAESLAAADELASDIGTMEQVYVNFRLFIEHVHGLAPCMGVVLAMTYLLNCGLVCIAVMCSRKFADLKTELMCIIIFGWVISNLLIVLASNFHANAKKLQPLMWSIIAELTPSQNARVRHMRFLWLKQVQILDTQGGLALDAFGLRVTYVNIIQIIIWTVTIIVLALKS